MTPANFLSYIFGDLQHDVNTRWDKYLPPGTINKILYFKSEQSTGSEELVFVIVGKANTVIAKMPKENLSSVYSPIPLPTIT